MSILDSSYPYKRGLPRHPLIDALLGDPLQRGGLRTRSFGIVVGCGVTYTLNAGV